MIKKVRLKISTHKKALPVRETLVPKMIQF